MTAHIQLDHSPPLFGRRLDAENLGNFHRTRLVVENALNHNWNVGGHGGTVRCGEQKDIFAGNEHPLAVLLLDATSGGDLKLRHSNIGLLERLANVFRRNAAPVCTPP